MSGTAGDAGGCGEWGGTSRPAARPLFRRGLQGIGRAASGFLKYPFSISLALGLALRGLLGDAKFLACLEGRGQCGCQTGARRGSVGRGVGLAGVIGGGVFQQDSKTDQSEFQQSLQQFSNKNPTIIPTSFQQFSNKFPTRSQQTFNNKHTKKTKTNNAGTRIQQRRKDAQQKTVFQQTARQQKSTLGLASPTAAQYNRQRNPAKGQGRPTAP